jgi:dTDP-glucose pyrophosphorylase
MGSIKQLVTHGDVSIKQAWRQLNDGGCRILFIADDMGILLGSITDGDIRRWILEDKSILAQVNDVMCKIPVFLKQGESKERIKQKMLSQRLGCVPVLNDDGKIVNVVFWDEVFMSDEHTQEIESIDLPVVIMAGGRGVRLDPFTKVLPKPLIPIGDKAVVEVIMEKFSRYGIHDFYLSLHYKAGMIKAYLQDCSAAYNVQYCEEPSPRGTAGSLALLADELSSTFIVSNADVIIDANYADIVRFHKENRHLLTLVCSMKHFPIPYGVVSIGRGGGLRGIEEKPEFDRLVLTGMYVVEPELLRMIPNDRLFHMTHLIEMLRVEGKEIGVYPISEKAWMDVGEIKAYAETLKSFE